MRVLFDDRDEATATEMKREGSKSSLRSGWHIAKKDLWVPFYYYFYRLSDINMTRFLNAGETHLDWA